jgi:cold shock CspA family protein
MHRIIDDPDYADDSFVKGLFVFARENASAEGEKNTQYTHSANALRLDTDIDDEDDFNRADTIETDGVREEGEISVLKEGYGFVGQPPQGTFFHYSDLTNCDFNDLHRGDRLTYEIGIGPEGKKKAINIELLR